MSPDRPPLTRIDDVTYRVGETTFLTNWSQGSSTVDHFTIMKPGALVERYAETLERFPGGNIVELGVREGGSTALIALLAQPRKLVALELVEPVPPALDAFIERHHLGATVRPHVGIDQADRATVSSIIDAEFGDEPLDLVVDDASHLLDPTTASFEVLFPRLREGGLFVLEDWAWESQMASGLGDLLASDPAARAAFERYLTEQLDDAGVSFDEAQAAGSRPLLWLVMELMLARSQSGDAVAEISIGAGWVVIVRGPAPLDAGSFRVHDLYEDHYGLLAR